MFSQISDQLRPREKIQLYGIETLTTPELLEVILGSGSGQVSVTQLAQQVSEKISTAKSVQLADLTQIKGIGLAKACQLVAATELVERLRPRGLPLVNSLEKVLQQVGELRTLTKEHVVCLYLNARMQLYLKETLAVGSVNQSVIAPRDIFSAIRQHPICFIIIIHNHPSGNATPSSDDLQFTERIWQAGQVLGVELLDHVIVAQDEHYSMKEQGILAKNHH